MLCSLLRDFCSLNKVRGLCTVGTDSLGHSNEQLSDWSRRPRIPCNTALNLDSHFGHVGRENLSAANMATDPLTKHHEGLFQAE